MGSDRRSAAAILSPGARRWIAANEANPPGAVTVRADPERWVAAPEELAARYLLALMPGDEGIDAGDSYEMLPRFPLPDSAEDPRGFVVMTAATIQFLALNSPGNKAIAYAERSLAALSRMPPHDLAIVADLLPWLRLACAYAYLTRGQLRPALQLCARVASSEQPFPQFAASGLAAIASALLGYPEEAIKYVTHVRATSDESWSATQPAALALLAQLLLDSLRLDTVACERGIVELRALAERMPLVRELAMPSITQAMMVVGQSREAVVILQNAIHNFRFDRGPANRRTALQWSLAIVRLSLGEPGTAIELASGPLDGPEHTMCFESIRGFCFLSLGMPHEALSATDPCIRMELTHNLRKLREVMVVRAGAFAELGMLASAAQSLKEFIDATESSELFSLSLLPSSTLQTLVSAAVSAGTYLPPEVMRLAAQPPNRLEQVRSGVGTLTASEKRLLVELCNDSTLDEIATRAFTSRNTIKSHNRNLFAKLGVSSRSAATDIAFTVGLPRMTDYLR